MSTIATPVVIAMLSNNLLTILGLVALIIAWPAVAKDKPDKNTTKRGGAAHQNRFSDEDKTSFVRGQPAADRRGSFTETERGVIQRYVERYRALPGKHERRLPPGLAKRLSRGGNLPPGWEKKCVPGEVLPPEVYQACHPLPAELRVNLPPAPDLTVTVAVDGKIVRLLEATREILDVFNVHAPF